MAKVKIKLKIDVVLPWGCQVEHVCCKLGLRTPDTMPANLLLQILESSLLILLASHLQLELASWSLPGSSGWPVAAAGRVHSTESEDKRFFAKS